MKKKRIVYIDVIRLFAMLLVILAHSCAAVLGHPSNSLNWRVSNAVVSITSIAVPLFFAISGTVILNSSKTTNLQYLFKHRLVRIVMPFVVWSVISAYGNSINTTYIKLNPWDSIINIFHQPVLVTYWFMYPLITLYLLSPLMKAMVDHTSTKVLDYALLLWFIFIILLPAIVQFTPKSFGVYFHSYFQSRIVISEWIGYFVLGYRLTREKHAQTNLWIIIPIIVIFLMERIYINFLTLNGYENYLNIISEIILPILIIFVYMTFQALESHYPHWFAKFIEFMAPLTYGIYLMHGITILTLQKYLGYTNYWMIFGITVAITVVVIGILSRIPVVKRLFT